MLLHSYEGKLSPDPGHQAGKLYLSGLCWAPPPRLLVQDIYPGLGQPVDFQACLPP